MSRTLVYGSRSHPLQPVGLGKGQHAEARGQEDAVPEGGAEHFAFMSHQSDGGNAHRDILWGDHLARHRTGGVGGGEQDRVHADLVGGGHLQIAEEQIAGRVAPAQEAGDPAQETARQREERSQAGQRRAQGVGHAGVVVEVSQGDDQAYRQARHAKLTECFPSGARPHSERGEKGEGGEQRGGECPRARRQRFERVDCRVRFLIEADENVLVKPRDCDRRAAHLKELQVGPGDHGDGKDHPGRPGGNGFAPREGRKLDAGGIRSSGFGARRGRRDSGFGVRDWQRKTWTRDEGLGTRREPSGWRLPSRIPNPETRNPTLGLTRLSPVQEKNEGSDGDERGDDVGNVRSPKVRHQELRQGEAGASHDGGRPGGAQSLASRHHQHQITRQQEREEGQLAADHGREFGQVETRYPRQSHDRNAERSECHGRGVGDQRYGNGLPRTEAQAHQQERRHGHRRTEPRRPLDQGAEAEGYQNSLDAGVAGAVLGHPAAQQIELARVHGEVVEPQRGKDDPHDGPQGVDKAKGGAGKGELRGHTPDEGGQNEGAGQAPRCRHVSGLAQHPHKKQDDEERDRRRQRGQGEGMERVDRLGPRKKR